MDRGIVAEEENAFLESASVPRRLGEDDTEKVYTKAMMEKETIADKMHRVQDTYTPQLVII